MTTASTMVVPSRRLKTRMKFMPAVILNGKTPAIQIEAELAQRVQTCGLGITRVLLPQDTTTGAAWADGHRYLLAQTVAAAEGCYFNNLYP